MSFAKQGLFARFDKRPNVYMFIIWAFYVLLNNTINATSDWMEATRDKAIPEFALWEPFAWEYTSAMSSLVLVPLVVWWFNLVPFSLSRIKRFVLLNLLVTIVYSATHVSLMVFFREVIYALVGSSYDFGALYSEFFYEYRKDALSYFIFMVLYYAYRFIYSRLKGEASLISQQDDQEAQKQDFDLSENDSSKSIEPVQTCPEHLLVKKLDKEFLVKVSDIEWLESSGNYVNLHAKGRIYPLRSSLSALLPRIASKDFVRVHRSFGVNLNQVESISTQPSGDGEIQLLSGASVALSRRYKDGLREKVK
jgi:DNA-binding LytR/AlgR family response regulator